MTTLTANSPTLPGYGLALYDSSGNLLTGFNGSETVFREVFSASFSGAENTEITVSGTLPTGITASNSIVVTNYDSGTGWSQTNVGYISGTSVKIRPTGTASTTRTGRVLVLQYKDASPGAGSYGLQIKNGDNDVVLDEQSVIWIVKETGTLPTLRNISDPSIGWTPYGTADPVASPSDTNYDEYAEYHVLTLPGSTYSTSKPFMVAVRCTTDKFIIQPYIFSNSGGYYQEIVFHRPVVHTDHAEYGFQYQYAILVSPNDYTPTSDGSTYGLEIYNSSNVLKWSSKWKQGIIQKLINLNQFTTGLNQNGTYDYETGYDGVTAPSVTSSPDPYAKATNASSGETVNISCSVDPLYTYAAFWAGNGKVEFNKCEVNTSGTTQYKGGGQHWPSVRFINGGASVDIKMHRTADGPNTAGYGTRITGSFHPTGYIALIRIR